MFTVCLKIHHSVLYHNTFTSIDVFRFFKHSNMILPSSNVRVLLPSRKMHGISSDTLSVIQSGKECVSRSWRITRRFFFYHYGMLKARSNLTKTETRNSWAVSPRHDMFSAGNLVSRWHTRKKKVDIFFCARGKMREISRLTDGMTS